MVRCTFGPRDQAHISVDEQHLSRLTAHETREIIIQLLVFGGDDLRRDIKHWLDGGKLDELGRYIAGSAATNPPLHDHIGAEVKL